MRIRYIKIMWFKWTHPSEKVDIQRNERCVVQNIVLVLSEWIPVSLPISKYQLFCVEQLKYVFGMLSLHRGRKLQQIGYAKNGKTFSYLAESLFCIELNSQRPDTVIYSLNTNFNIKQTYLTLPMNNNFESTLE